MPTDKKGFLLLKDINENMKENYNLKSLLRWRMDDFLSLRFVEYLAVASWLISNKNIPYN